MPRTFRTAQALFAGLALVAAFAATHPAAATMIFYYDPATGNVAFDSRETRSGETLSWGLSLYTAFPEIQFRTDKHIRLTDSPFFELAPSSIFEYFGGQGFRGLYTVGDILPPGLDEQTWSTLFSVPSTPSPEEPVPGLYSYIDVLGGEFIPPAEFRYGPPPDLPLNYWSTVDPLSLEWATAAKLIYNYVTGEVTLDTTGPNGGHISIFFLQDPLGRFIPSQATSFPQATLQSVTETSYALTAGAISPNQYNLGAILPAGLSNAEFGDLVDSSLFVAREAFNGADFNIVIHGKSFESSTVPTPATGMMLGLAVLGLARRRAA